MNTKEGKMRILLACAESLLLRQVCGLLRENEEIELVGCTSDGKRAWEMIQQQKPDLAVLDGDLPYADGFVLASWIRRERMDNMSIILLSSFIGAQTYAECSLLHIDVLLRKPVCAAALYERIRLTGSCMDKGNELERRLAQILQELGMRERTSGYRCTLLTVRLFRETNGASITKVIYHAVAQRLNVESSSVERNMRYTIRRIWEKCDKNVLKKYFGAERVQDSEPISNRAFCAALTEYLQREEHCE